MTQNAKTKPKIDGVERKLNGFIEQLEAVETAGHCYGLSIPRITDYLEWVLKFKPEHREHANFVIDKVLYLMDEGYLEGSDYWDRF